MQELGIFYLAGKTGQTKIDVYKRQVQDWIRSGNLDRDGLKKEIREDPYYLCEEKPIQYLEGMLTYTDVLKENGYTCRCV